MNEQIKMVTDEMPVVDMFINKNEQKELKEFRELEKAMEELQISEPNDPVVKNEIKNIAESIKSTVENGTKEKFKETAKSLREKIKHLQNELYQNKHNNVNNDDKDKEKVNTIELARLVTKHLIKVINYGNNPNRSNGNDVWSAIERYDNGNKKRADYYISETKYKEVLKDFVRSANFYLDNIDQIPEDKPYYNEMTEYNKDLKALILTQNNLLQSFKNASMANRVISFKTLKANIQALGEAITRAVNDNLFKPEPTLSKDYDPNSLERDDSPEAEHVFALKDAVDKSPSPRLPSPSPDPLLEYWAVPYNQNADVQEAQGRKRKK